MKKYISFFLIICMLMQFGTMVLAADDSAMVEYSGLTPSLTNITSATAASSVLEAVEAGGIKAVKLLATKSIGQSSILVNIRNKYMCELKDGIGVNVMVTYYDEGTGVFLLKYDGRTNSAKESEIVRLTNTCEWKTYTFHLYDAYFANRYSNSDFALCLYSDRTGFPAEAVILKSIEIKPSGKVFPIDLSENENAGNLFIKGEQAIVSLEANNITNDEIGASYNITATNSYGETAVKSGKIDFAPGKSAVKIPTGITECGAYDANIEIFDSGKLYGEYKTNFSISVASRNKNSGYGMNTHYRIVERNPEISIPMVKKLGAGMIRDEIPWASCETQKGVIEIPEVFTNYVNSAVKNDTDVLVVLGYTNKFYDDGLIPKSSEGLEAFGRYVYKVVSELKGKVDTFEVWNEFHHNAEKLDASYYVNLLRAAYTQAKRANPDCTIVGLGGMPGVWAYWVGNTLEAGAAQYMDALSLHEYDNFKNPERRMFTWIDNVKQYMRNNNAENIPIWITETGWSTAEISEKDQYAYGIRQYIGYKNIGIDKYFWYDFKNDGLNGANTENSFGTIYNNADTGHVPYSAKPSYVAFSNMNDKIGDAQIEEYSQNSDNTQIYKFKKADDSNVWVLWNIEQKTTTQINIGENEIEVFDVFGNAEQLSSNTGVFNICVSDEPIYITKKGYDISTGIKEINYKTGEISVQIAGISHQNAVMIEVLNPGMEISDIYDRKQEALCWISQANNVNGVYEFTFTASREGVYNIYANTGEKIVKLAAAYYKPLGAEISVWQEGAEIDDFSKLAAGSPIVVKAIVDNSYGLEEDYLFACGLYKDGKLVAVSSENGEFLASKPSKTLELSIETDKEYDTIKAFLWKDKTRLIPVTDKFCFTDKANDDAAEGDEKK